MLRAAYAGALLAGVIAAWTVLLLSRADNPDEFPEIIRSIFSVFCRVQFLLATMLAAMTFARAVCREQERGTMDLLILSPLSRTEILLGKLGGEFLGLTALVAAGIPVFFLLIPLGGLTVTQILSLQGTVLAQVLVAGGACVALAAAMGRALSVMIAAWLILGAASGGHLAGRWWTKDGAAFWNLLESISIYRVLDGQLASVGAEPAPALRALAIAAVVSVLCCGVGSLMLERRLVRGAGVGVWARGSAWIRRRASSLAGARLFRPLVSVEHPLMKRECAIYRDLPFRVVWVGMIALYGLAIRHVLLKPWGGGVEHAALALGGLMVGALVSIVTGALSIGYDRRKGTIQALLASGVAAEDIVRARMAALLLRALHFMALPAIYLAIVAICARLAPPAELLWRIPAGVSGLVLATFLMMGVTFDLAVSCRRPEVAGLMAVLVGIPAGIFVVGFVGAAVPTFAIGLPLMIAVLSVGYANSIQKLPRRLFI
jgi:ABC-type transport system involved in multi-copper enzyme maturation permease subunit